MKDLFCLAKERETELTAEIADLDRLSAIDLVIRTLTALRNSLDGATRRALRERLIAAGLRSHSRPETVTAHGPSSTEATLQIRRRSSRSALTEQEIQLLNKYGISTSTVVETEDTYIVNSKYSKNKGLLKMVSDKLREIPDLPKDFLLKQKGVTKTVVSEASISQVFEKIDDKDTIELLLDIVSIYVLQTKTIGQDLRSAFSVVSDLLGRR